MIRVRLTLDPDGSVCLESPYDAGFVAGLKAAIDYGGRQWAPDRKRWLISALYSEELLQFLQYVGAQVQDDRHEAGALAPLPPMPPELRDAYDVLFLAYTAPLCVAEASFRALAKYWHPDKGGDPAQFQHINNAMAIIRQHLDPKAPDDDLPF